MPEYEKSVKLSENVIPHDLIELGGALFEVLSTRDHDHTIGIGVRCIANLAEQRKITETINGTVVFPKGLMIEILK